MMQSSRDLKPQAAVLPLWAFIEVLARLTHRFRDPVNMASKFPGVGHLGSNLLEYFLVKNIAGNDRHLAQRPQQTLGSQNFSTDSDGSTLFRTSKGFFVSAKRQLEMRRLFFEPQGVVNGQCVSCPKCQHAFM
jgi:hypothetical protein